MLEFLLVLAVLAAAVTVIAWPLTHPSADERPQDPELADLEAAREAKYREIRDAELDRRTGKLSQEDFERIEAALRAEAADILARLDAARGRAAAPPG